MRGDVVCKMIGLEDEINADLNALIGLKHEIVTIIKRVEAPDLQTFLEFRYPRFNTWEEIYMALHLDIRRETDAIRRAEP